jgi:sulfur-oxidizing protein SoxZ
VILDAEFGRSMSTDPLLGLRLRGARSEDRLRVSWEDNRGMTRTDESVIA